MCTNLCSQSLAWSQDTPLKWRDQLFLLFKANLHPYIRPSPESTLHWCLCRLRPLISWWLWKRWGIITYRQSHRCQHLLLLEWYAKKCPPCPIQNYNTCSWIPERALCTGYFHLTQNGWIKKYTLDGRSVYHHPSTFPQRNPEQIFANAYKDLLWTRFGIRPLPARDVFGWRGGIPLVLRLEHVLHGETYISEERQRY